jgi:hypothetical protein
MEKILIKKRKTTESTDTRTAPGKIKLVYSGLPHNKSGFKPGAPGELSPTTFDNSFLNLKANI